MTYERPDSVQSWLLEPSEPSMRYLASRDLLRSLPSERSLSALRAAIPRSGWAKKILSRQKETTYWATKTTCYRPKFRSTIWQLQVLADLGLTSRDERISNAVDFWFELHCALDGGYSPEVKGRHGHLCTTGNMVRSLIHFGYLKDERVQSAIQWLVDAQLDDGGWDCFGRKNGTIDGWEAMSAFSEIPEKERSSDVREATEKGADFYLERRLLHEGQLFRPWFKLRYPWHYHYDVLVGLDFMSALGYSGDPRMGEALAHLKSKRSPDGRWDLDSTNGNLRLETPHRPSKMITFLALRVLRRASDSA